MEAYAFLSLLKQEGAGLREAILRTRLDFEVPYSSLYSWYHGHAIPLGAVDISVRPELFYVLGSLLGDGCAYKWKRGGYQLILCGDRRFADKYATKISLCLGRSVRAYPNRCQNIWFVSIGNCGLYFLFKTIRKDPPLISEMIRSGDFLRNGLAFIEGFFDAEGCVKIIKEPVRKVPKICLDITNTNIAYLELVRSLMSVCLGIEGRYSSQEAHLASDGYYRKKVYHLRVYKKEDVRRFLEELNTTKLKKEKELSVRRWLSVPNCNTTYARNSPPPDPNSGRSTNL